MAPNLHAFGGLTAATLSETCDQALEYDAGVIQDTVNLGVSAVGVAFRDPMGQPGGALSVAALSQRMTKQQIREMAAALKTACQEVEQRLRAHKRGAWRAGSPAHPGSRS